jgi:hypothetical protein
MSGVNRRGRQSPNRYSEIRVYTAVPENLADTAACKDCDAHVRIVEVAPDVYSASVAHDDSCPWWQAFQLRAAHNPRVPR